MIWCARARASRTIASARSRACASSCWPFSAAASPCAILRERSSIMPRTSGQTKVIVNQTSTMNTSICTMSVRLMFTAYASVLPVQRAHEGIREREEQCEADTDHRDRVQQARDQEHLYAQRRQQLRLARRAFDETAAQNAETDGGAECPHAEDDTHGQHGHGLDLCNAFHSTLLQTETCKKPRAL